MSPKIIIFLTMFVDILGISVVIPVLPFYVERFGATPFELTLLFSVFSLFSFMSSPVLGAWSDKIGRRPVLLLSIASTFIGWVVFASAHSLWILFLGRIIDGAAAGNITIAQSYLADISKDEKDRIENFSMIGGIFGISFIVGPMIGGLLSVVSYSAPFWFVSALALVNLFFGYLYLPETNIHAEHGHKPELNPLRPLVRALKNKPLIPGFIVWFIFGVAMSIQQSVFSLYMQKVFSFDATHLGWFMSGIGVVIILNQAVLIKHFWFKIKEPYLEIAMMVSLILGFLLLSTKILWVFVVGVIFYTIAHPVIRSVLTSQMMVNDKTRGEMIGTLSSVMSLSMIVGPIAGGLLFIQNESAPFFFSAIIAFVSIVLMIQNKKTFSKNVPPSTTPAQAI